MQRILEIAITAVNDIKVIDRFLYMQYLLTEEEIKEFNQLKKQQESVESDRVVLKQLRKKIMKEAKFTCYHDLTSEQKEEQYVDDGYCDECPLSFCHGINDDLGASHRFCPHQEHLYSK